jgi:hypothetical protein
MLFSYEVRAGNVSNSTLIGQQYSIAWQSGAKKANQFQNNLT